MYSQIWVERDWLLLRQTKDLGREHFELEPTMLILEMQNVLTAFLASFLTAKLTIACFNKKQKNPRLKLKTSVKFIWLHGNENSDKLWCNIGEMQ